MNSSLSVVLPLYNVESILPAVLDAWLEILPELTSRFEVVLVDDGSTDATLEAARELSLSYPQVQLLVHPARLGAQEALRSALRYSTKDAVLVCRDVSKLDPHEITAIWERLTPDGAAAGYIESSAAAGQVPPLPTKFAKYLSPAESPFPDVLLVPRRLLVGWQQPANREPLLTHLRQSGFSIHNFAVRASNRRTSWAVLAARLQQRLGGRPTNSSSPHGPTKGRAVLRSDAAADKAIESGGRRPHSLLSKLRALAWGE